MVKLNQKTISKPVINIKFPRNYAITLKMFLSFRKSFYTDQLEYDSDQNLKFYLDINNLEDIF